MAESQPLVSPKVFWTSTFALCAIVSLVFDYRTPIYVWVVAAGLVLVFRFVVGQVLARRSARASAELAHAAAAHEIAAKGGADDLINTALRAARAACDAASAGISDRMAPTVAADIANTRAQLDKFRRTDDSARDLCLARSLEQRALGAQANSGRGLRVRSARGIGAVLGLWRSFDN